MTKDIKEKIKNSGWIAIPSWDDKTIVAYGDDVRDVSSVSKERGYEFPIIMDSYYSKFYEIAKGLC